MKRINKQKGIQDNFSSYKRERETEREAAVTFGICGISPAKQPDVHHERDHPEPIHT